MEKLDRYKGCLLGLAVGDALGIALEFKSPGSFEPIDDIIGGGPFNLKPGEWTDDTSMALCLAESLIERKRFDPVDQMDRYCRWYKKGHLSSNGTCFDIGNTTREALNQFFKTRQPFCGPTHPRSAGNGSIMRLAPIPLFYGSEPEEAIKKAADSSRTTHGAKEAIDACRYLAGLLVGVVNEVSKEELLSKRFSPVPGLWSNQPLSPKIDEVASGSFKERHPPEIKGTGYVVKSLEAALWAFYNSSTFKDGALLAVNLGDDADTTGAVYGQLAGAFYGKENIPKAWVEKITHGDLILHFSEKLFNLF